MEETITTNSLNITQTIIDTINKILESLFSSIDNSLYSTLDKITFIDSDILNNNYFNQIFGTSTSNGMLLISNSLLLGFLLYFSAKNLLSHITNLKIESPSQFIFKLIIFSIFMNFSFDIIDILINFFSNITYSIQSIGENLFDKTISFSELITIINSNISINTNSINIFSIDGIIKSTLSVSLLTLIFSYSIRYIMLKIFILLSPFAFLSLSLEKTSWFFKSWLKNIFSLLFIQIIVSIVLLLLFSMDFTSENIITKFLYVGGIYTLIKANSFVREFVGGVSTNFSQYVNNYYSNLH